MALTAQVVDKPQPGVTMGVIPPDLVKLLDALVPDAMKDPKNKEIILNCADEAEAKLMSGYAKAWGGRQDPQIAVRKIANRRDMTDSQARLVVCLLSDATPRGRAVQSAQDQ